MIQPVASSFEIEPYLGQRAGNPSFVMVEIGHGFYPLVDQQADLQGQRAYIGIEAGMRSVGGWQATEARSDDMRRQYADRNAFFLTHDLGQGEVIEDFVTGDMQYRGEFKPETILPDGAADEIVASNVFCDPLIAYNFRYTTELLAEMARLISPMGTIVLRETITPWKVKFIEEFTARVMGLEILRKVSPSDQETWAKLEEVFGTHKDVEDFKTYDSSYYLFLKKL